jgi:perosamine synthetase
MKYNQIEPWFDNKETKALVDYMNSGGFLTEYKQTLKVEQMIADYIGSKYCTMMFNGTVTLLASLMAFDIKPKDEVIIPDFTMIASVTPVSLIGAKPVFVDVERETLCMDVGDLENKITDNTKAIMLVSINGRYPLELAEILETCFDQGIKIIEDAAQSLGSFYHKRHVGTFGDVGSFSFSMPKIVTAGNGGAIVTNNDELYRKLRMIKDFGRAQSGVDEYETIGLNFKYNDVLATILIEQMKKLPARVEMKKNIYKWYQKYLKNVEGIEFIETSNEVAPWFIDILVENRDALAQALKEKGIGTRPFYPALHNTLIYRGENKFPNSEYISKHGLWLPSSSFLTEENVKEICGGIIDSLLVPKNNKSLELI